jgi:hypothetical protein
MPKNVIQRRSPEICGIWGGTILNTELIVIVLVVGIVIGAAIVYVAQQGRTRRLRNTFGPEYGRVVGETGDRLTAEAMLLRRQNRVRQLHIRPLSATEQAHFQESWREVQARFVDNPNLALTEADRLIGEVMSVEGYPVLEFEQRAEDISVDHPGVIENYRQGHRITLTNAQGGASTEDLRKAMIHYRKLFEELVGQPSWAEPERAKL